MEIIRSGVNGHSAGRPGRREKKLLFLEVFSVAGLLLSGLLCGCGSTHGVAREMLQPTKPEEFALNAQPRIVWESLLEQIKATPNAKILATEPDNMMVSWIEQPNAGGAPAKLKKKKGAAFTDWDQLSAAEATEAGNDRVAITTALVASAPSGSLLRFRRVYYGIRTQPRIAYSSGAYESLLTSRLSEKLNAKAVPRS